MNPEPNSMEKTCNTNVNNGTFFAQEDSVQFELELGDDINMNSFQKDQVSFIDESQNIENRNTLCDSSFSHQYTSQNNINYNSYNQDQPFQESTTANNTFNNTYPARNQQQPTNMFGEVIANNDITQSCFTQQRKTVTKPRYNESEEEDIEKE